MLAEGELEVLLRRDDGLVIDTMRKGAVVGEMSLLTGARRNTTMRPIDGAIVYEIGAEQCRPVLQAHPHIVDALADLMADRLRERRERLAAYDADRERAALGRRIKNVLFAA